MLKQRFILVLIFINVLANLPTLAQYVFENPKNLTVKDGLPSNSIRAITQDMDGFIWIGTDEGICRYDGSQIKIYQNQRDTPNSLIDDRIQKLMICPDQLWIATFMGLSVLDLHSDKFRNYVFRDPKLNDPANLSHPNLVSSFLYDRQGEIWVGTADMGLCKYLPDQDTFELYRFDQKKVAAVLQNPEGVDRIYAIEQDISNDSIIWVGTGAGLLELNKYSKQMEWHVFPQEDKLYELSLNRFRRMYLHENGLLYVGAWGTGVNVFNQKNKTFTPLPFKKSDKDKLIERTSIGDIRLKSKNELWVTTSAGLAVYNIPKQEVVMWKRNQLKEKIFYGIDHLDGQGRIWGGSPSGVFIFDPTVQQYVIHSYEHLNPENSGFAFYTYQNPADSSLTVVPRAADQLFHLDWQTSEWSGIPIPKQFLESDFESFSSRGISVDPNGNLTISYQPGLMTYNPANGKLTPLLPDLDLAFDQLADILWDSHQRLWINAFEDGLIRWDKSANSLKRFKQEMEPGAPPQEARFYSNLIEDSRGNIWINRHDGFSVYDHQRDTFFNHLFSENSTATFQTPIFFSEDLQGRVWACTAGQLGYGLAGQPEKGIVQKYDVSHLIGERGFSGMQTDQQGNVWGWTDKYLLKLNPVNMEMKTYSFEYGANGGDFFSFTILPTGDFVFGGRNSVYITHPDKLQHNQELPIPYLLGIDVLEKPWETDTVSHKLTALHLKHWQNFFSFSFAALGFTLAEHNQFRYQLENFDEDWIEAKGRRYANYTNVPSGNYLFHLQAANNEGIWNDKIFTLPVTIDTPWWAAWWFRLSVLYFIGLIIYAIYRFRISQIRKEERLRTDFEKKLVGQEMTALRAQMNPHFLFNSLNSIDSYIIKNETHKASEYLNNFARLIRLILQNSRSNYVNLKDEIDALELYMKMESLRFKDKFDYEIKVDENIDVESIDIPPMLMQPYVENAIWHGLMHKQNGQPGKVTLSIQNQNDALHCIIVDNGIGRERAMEIRASRPTRGKKSVGMEITQDRISMINKLYNTNTSVKIFDLKDEDGLAAGTKVELVIPIE